jgi:hypothetical protein
MNILHLYDEKYFPLFKNLSPHLLISGTGMQIRVAGSNNPPDAAPISMQRINETKSTL